MAARSVMQADTDTDLSFGEPKGVCGDEELDGFEHIGDGARLEHCLHDGHRELQPTRKARRFL